MAKLDMAGQRKRPLTGLLRTLYAATVFIAVAGRTLPITGPGNLLNVQYEVNTENLETGRAFSLALVVNHGEILEITVIPPDFRDKFRLDAQRTSTRLVRDNASNGLERLSVFEFTLVPLEAGSQRIPPFAVRVHEQTIWTTPIHLTIAPARTAEPPLFHWETPLPTLTVGEWSVFRLLVTSPNTLPKDTLHRLRFAPPPEAVVERAAPALHTPNTATIELRVLPIRTGTFTLHAIDFEAEAPNGAIMRLHIPELNTPIRQRQP
jgi:hypothetical protein